MIKKENILHYPRLDTILMVEDCIKEHSGEYKKRKLWESLPRKTMYQTYSLIIDYLKSSGKIGFDKKGTIAWIYNPKLVKLFMSKKKMDWNF